MPVFIVPLAPKWTSCRRYSISNRPSQDCSSQNLSALPLLFPDVISMNLAHNSFPVIDRFPRNYSYLHTLKLDNSGIRKISVQALSSLNSIRVLDLSGNQLKTITFGFARVVFSRFMPDLSSLSSLRYVDLSNNEIETVKPSYLPPNVESLRLSANKIAHLTPWPFLRKLQELDVSFNPLECVCPLWEFIGWAESLALFQEDSLPSPFVEQMTLSIGDPLRMCCLISAHPKPVMWWEHEQQNISRDASLRRIPESGQIEFCLEAQSVGIEDLGGYRCFAQLEARLDVVSSKEFHVNRVQEPLVLKSPPNIIFYCQFSIGLFVFAFCCATCCILRRGQPMKTGPKKDSNHCHTVSLLILHDFSPEIKIYKDQKHRLNYPVQV
ncbi:unnamed protein product [Haemonchus placei]|uniref:Ig-like domain-containing protein n=1 Tax=Haemonchus placei TaxID=6290 RepID=A0A0N4W0X6_HAEPC|nr:unnamed protein product [Haemonchus placei]